MCRPGSRLWSPTTAAEPVVALRLATQSLTWIFLSRDCGLTPKLLIYPSFVLVLSETTNVRNYRIKFSFKANGWIWAFAATLAMWAGLSCTTKKMGAVLFHRAVVAGLVSTTGSRGGSSFSHRVKLATIVTIKARLRGSSSSISIFCYLRTTS